MIYAGHCQYMFQQMLNEKGSWNNSWAKNLLAGPLAHPNLVPRVLSLGTRLGKPPASCTPFQRSPGLDRLSGGYSRFQVTGRIKILMEAKITTQKNPRASNKTPKHYGTKNSHAEFPSLTNFQKAKKFHCTLVAELSIPQKSLLKSSHPGSSVGRVPVFWAGGQGFKPRPDQHSGSLNNWEGSAAFVVTSANRETF